MDVRLEAGTGNMGQDWPSRGNHNTQPDHSGATVDHSETTSEEAPSLDRMDQTSCDSSLTGEVTTSQDPDPFSHGVTKLTQRTEFTTCEKHLKHGSAHSGQVANGAPPICTPPSLSTSRLSCPPPQSTTNNGHVHLDKRLLPSTSTANSQHSLKTTASQIQQVAGDEPCASLVLNCLFCQLSDCFLALGEGCHRCVSSLCSCMCCCEPSPLDPLLVEASPCAPCTLEPTCPSCDLSLCTTECLELGLEISQLLLH